MSSRESLVMRGVSECVTESELQSLLNTKKALRAYIGYEPSGLLHAGSLVPMLKVRDLLEAGFEVTILLADWHGYINDKLGGSWNNLKAGVEYQQLLFSTFAPGVKFTTASELVRSKNYWEDVLKVSKATTLARMRRALAIMGRDEKGGDGDTSKFIYPAMQVVDIHHLEADLALGGLDQRHAHMLARDVADKLDWHKPVALHTPLLASLGGPGRMETDAKMSKSDPVGALLVHDTLKQLQKKLSKAYCPEKERNGNPILDLWEHLLFPGTGAATIERPEKFGGNLEFKNYSTLESDFIAGNLHPLDLKNGTATALYNFFEPLRDACEKNPEPYSKLLGCLK